MNYFYQRLRLGKGIFFCAFTIIAAFVTYTSMYAFRKPFTVGLYAGEFNFFGYLIEYKIFFIISQVFGYTLSKFLGIKYISEARENSRIKSIFYLIVTAGLTLLGFALVPMNFKFIFLFLNGIPLGMIWGLVMCQLEGRSNTEILAAGLSVTFIVASGVVKTVGRQLVLFGISEEFMPFVTGLVFIPLLALGCFMLHFVPPPNEDDIRLRTKRQPMNKEQRKNFFMRYAPGLIALIFFYMILTALRDLRDNYAREIWEELGVSSSAIFTSTEIPIAILVLIVMGSIMYIKNNRRALHIVHLVLIFASVLIGLSAFLFRAQLISGTAWMILMGLGLFLAYVPFNSVLFDRIIAHTKHAGTAGFLIYVADSFGYLSAIGVMLAKNFGAQTSSWLNFILQFSEMVSFTGVVAIAFSLAYFSRRERSIHVHSGELRST